MLNVRVLACCRYDSAGVCIDGTAQRLAIIKATGKVAVLAELANERVDEDATCPGDEVAPLYCSFACKPHSQPAPDFAKPWAMIMGSRCSNTAGTS